MKRVLRRLSTAKLPDLVKVEPSITSATVFDNVPQKVFDDSVNEAFENLRLALKHTRKIKSVSARKNQENAMEMDAESEVPQVNIDALYDVLKKPVAKTLTPSPDASVLRKLSTDYIRSLQLRLQAAQKKMQLSEDQEKEGLVEIVANDFQKDVTELIHVNGLANRPDVAQSVFDNFVASGLAPNLFMMNALLEAYALAKNAPKAVQVFQSMHSTHGIVPNTQSYTLLIQALAENNLYIQANRVLKNMINNGMKPSTVAFQHLIKAALGAGKVKRAWELFDHIRTELQVPSESLYTLMISACKENQDAEKALDLVQDMADNGIEPSPRTYAALMKALSTREDYYQDVFSVLEQMIREGLEIDASVYSAVMTCCVDRGDVFRARLLWNAIVKEGNPDIGTVETMIQVYGSAFSRSRRGEIFEADESVQDMKDLLKIQDDTESNQRAIKTTGVAFKDLALDLDFIWSHVPKESISSQTLDKLVKAYSNMAFSDVGIPKAKEVFESFYDKFNVEKTGNSFLYFMRGIARSKKHMAEMGDSIWQKFIEFEREREDKMEKEPHLFSRFLAAEETSAEDENNGILLVKTQEMKKDDEVSKLLRLNSDLALLNKTKTMLSHVEKEQIRQMQARDKETVFECFLAMIRGYSRYLTFANRRIKQFDKVLQLIEAAKSFRQPFYLPLVEFKHIWATVEKMVDHAELSGSSDYIKQLIQLCPKQYDAIEEMKKTLRMKHLSRNWWGWDALGIGMRKRSEIIKAREEGYWTKQRTRTRRLDIE